MNLRWDAPGPYEVLFTTRQGGVSEGPFESLNLGKAVGDDADRVDENRRRVCAEAGADPELLTLNRQRHSATVHRAEPGSRGVPGDGLWSDEPGQPMLALSADCLTIAVVRTNGDRPAARRPARRMAGSPRGDRRGRVRRARRREAGRRGRPGDRPVLLRGRPRSRGALRGAIRLGAHAAAASSTSGRRPSERSERGRLRWTSTASTSARTATRICSSPSGARAGRAEPTASSALLRADEVRERYERIRAEVGSDVTVVAATKYVSPDEMAVLAEAGIEIVGENRAQDLAAKHERYGDAFRWHFIGHLQSRKAKTVNEICELVHSLASESAARRLSVPALVEVNLSGEESKSGLAPRGAGGVPGRVRRRPRV